MATRLLCIIQSASTRRPIGNYMRNPRPIRIFLFFCPIRIADQQKRKWPIDQYESASRFLRVGQSAITAENLARSESPIGKRRWPSGQYESASRCLRVGQSVTKRENLARKESPIGKNENAYSDNLDQRVGFYESAHRPPHAKTSVKKNRQAAEEEWAISQ